MKEKMDAKEQLKELADVLTDEQAKYIVAFTMAMIKKNEEQ